MCFITSPVLLNQQKRSDYHLFVSLVLMFDWYGSERNLKTIKAKDRNGVNFILAYTQFITLQQRAQKL